MRLPSLLDPEIVKARWGGGAEDNVTASSSFMANAHNELYAFYTRKRRIIETKIILSQ